MTPRLLAGYALVLAGFVLVFLLAYGVIEPFGSTAAARDVAGLLAAAAPGLLIPLAVFLLGLWLVKGARRR
jgi:nitrate reductase gamma subunit